VDERKVKAAIQTGAKVMLFFRSHHDEKNTIESEVKRANVFREKVQYKCARIDYNNNIAFEEVLRTKLAKIACKYYDTKNKE